MTAPTRTSEQVKTTYLRHPLTFVGEHTVIVFAPDGRCIGSTPSLSTARRIVRADRAGVVMGRESLLQARYELSLTVGPDTDARVEALADAIMELPEFKTVGGGAIGVQPLLCACGTPLIACDCGDDRCPKCDPKGCPGA